MKTRIIKALALAACMAACLPQGAAAQSAIQYDDDYAFDAPFWGLRVSLDLSCPGKWKVGNDKVDMFGTGAGVNVGVVYNRPFGGGLFVEPGVGLFYDTMDADTPMAGEDHLTPVETLNAWVGTWGLHIPLMVGYRVDLTPSSAIFLSTGPQLEIGFNAHLSDDMPEGSSLAGELYDTLLRRFDCQWKVEAGVAFSYNYYVGVSAGFGLANLARHSPVTKFHRNLVSITVGYNF
ncbi:MAG: PorT family protein [Pseudoflavonifractor sp.]|nr:PorT family protein [Alloprevotella sp.]MCM1117443.1 PorT family protein [Pseudoflavonifractor sp.]